MFYLVDVCGKELADCLEKATADGKLSQDHYSYIMHRIIRFQKQKKFYGYKIYLNNGKFTVSVYHIVRLYAMPCY
jgi:hypothetical protein